MSSFKEHGSSLTLAAAVLATTVAAVTHKLTKKREDDKHKALVLKQYKREKMLKEKTALARQAVQEPPAGKLLEDVFVDKIFLWECQDLRKNFPSADTRNVMKNYFKLKKNPVQSPLLRTVVSNVDAGTRGGPTSTRSHHSTEYNKLITDHECILGEIVRKPNMATHTVAYMRAGPRRYLHFDPKDVNAAIVTCGGL